MKSPITHLDIYYVIYLEITELLDGPQSGAIKYIYCVLHLL